MTTFFADVPLKVNVTYSLFHRLQIIHRIPECTVVPRTGLNVRFQVRLVQNVIKMHRSLLRAHMCVGRKHDILVFPVMKANSSF